MFDVIQRVLSGEKVQDDNNESRPGQQGDGSSDYRSFLPTTNDDATMNSIASPVIVENEMEADQAAVDERATVSPENTPDSSHTLGSSLSDVSVGHPDANKVTMTVENTNMIIDSDEFTDQYHPYQQLQHHHQHPISIPEQAVATFVGDRFPRNDSKVSNDSSCGSMRAGSHNSSRDWGWFEDVHGPDNSSSPYLKRKDVADDKANKKKGKKTEASSLHRSGLDNDVAAMAVTAPNYVLEESLSSQRLWKDTAGCRPPQPVEERAFFEQMWAQNFARSQVEYRMPVEVLTATSPISLSPFADGNFDSGRGADLSNFNLVAGDRDPSKTQDVAEATLISRLNDPRTNFSSKVLEPHHYEQTVINKTVKGSGSDGDLKVLVKGDNVFGTTVSKSFARSSEKGEPISGVDTVNISVASYRVVESAKHGKYAQFLVIYREGSIRDTVGVWKRYSDFVELAKKVTQAHEGCAAVIANMSPLAMTEEHDTEHLPNAITSWRLLKKRQRWYRCLDAGYLSLKVFLLERFLHDILFESSNPHLLREFVGAEEIDDNLF